MSIASNRTGIHVLRTDHALLAKADRWISSHDSTLANMSADVRHALELGWITRSHILLLKWAARRRPRIGNQDLGRSDRRDDRRSLQTIVDKVNHRSHSREPEKRSQGADCEARSTNRIVLGNVDHRGAVRASDVPNHSRPSFPSYLSYVRNRRTSG